MGPRDAELRPLIDVRNWFLLNILRMDGQNSTKFCINIIIDKIYIGIVKRPFRKCSTELQPLIDVRKWVFAQYLENGWTELTNFVYTLSLKRSMFVL